MISLPKQSKTAELVNRLGAIAHSAEVDEFALARIRSEASQIMDADPAGAHTVMGCIAAIKGLPEEARRHHQIAVQHDAGVQARYNYAVSLALLAENVEALRVATNALEQAPDMPELLDQTIMLALANGRFGQAADLCTRWESLFPDRPHEFAPSASLLAAKVGTGEFSEDSAQEVLEIASSIQRAKKVRRADGSFIWNDPEDPSCFVYERRVFTTPAQAAQMNEEFADRLSERSDLMEDPGIRFIPMFIGMLP